MSDDKYTECPKCHWLAVSVGWCRNCGASVPVAEPAEGLAESVSCRQVTRRAGSRCCGCEGTIGDVWWHENEACEPVYGSRVTTVASCPEHEGMRREDL